MLPIAAVISTLFAAVASATAFRAGAFPAARWSHSSVAVRYDSPVDITVGEPVIVALTVDNQREDAIRVDLGFNRTGAAPFASLSTPTCAIVGASLFAVD